ncbi:response regulator [Labilibacter sediminis]|nr:response regulator [Labilibacter sediminis]
MMIGLFKVKVVLVLNLLLINQTAFSIDAHVNENYLISYLSVNNGLSHNEVTTICQDKYGFMWFGTRGGLNRFDGYTFKHFKPGVNSFNTLHNPSVEGLYNSKGGSLWIGAKAGGYSIYDVQRESFSYKSDSLPEVPKRIYCFYEDLQGQTWIGTGLKEGLFRYDKDNSSTRFLKKHRVRRIVQTSDSTIWCGTDKGLKYKKVNEKFKNINLNRKGNREVTDVVIDPHDPYLWIVGWDMDLVRFNYVDFTFERFNLPIPHISKLSGTFSLMDDNQGRLWVGTWGHGLYLFNKHSKTFTKVNIKPSLVAETNKDYDVILDIHQDAGGVIWIGTDGGGIVKLSATKKFNTLHSDARQSKNNISVLNSNNISLAKGKNKLNKDHINAIHETSDGRLWVGTKGNGLFVTTDKVKYDRVRFQPDDPMYNTSNVVIKSLYEDNTNLLWVSVEDGIYVIDLKKAETPALVQVNKFFNTNAFIGVKKVHDFYMEGDEFWLATQRSGLYLFERKGNSFNNIKVFQSSPEEGQLHSNRVTSIARDKKGNLWVGTYNGLYLYNPEDSVFTSAERLVKGDSKVICNIVTSIWVDDDNTIWFGTPCGLNYIDRLKDNNYSLNYYTVEDGLSGDYVNAILGDERGNVWISTNVGLSKIKKKTGRIRNFNKSDGVGDNHFSESACFLSKDGTMYFGGYSNFTYFKPSEIEVSPIVPKIVVSDFKIYNKQAIVSEKGWLTNNINEIEKLTLGYKEREFSFEISALDYTSPHRNNYAYWLEGYDDDRVFIGNRRHISFSNLEPGDYTLHLYATNSNGLWNEKGFSLPIEILPAPWETWYAIVIYIILVLSVVIVITVIAKKQERLINNIEIEKVLRRQESRVNEYKLNFFTNISHEIRTPLTLILSPLKELLNKDFNNTPAKYFHNKVQLIYNNTGKLTNLVNQLLEFRKMEAGKVILQAQEGDIIGFLEEICDPFSELAITQNVEFKKSWEVNSCKVFFDQEKLGIVFNNLLSNAFKFTGNPSFVSVSFHNEKDDIVIKVSNNGEGIPENDLNHLFDRFYQASGTSHVGGTGIGLALVKSFINLHKGTVSVESTKDELTTFTITLKKGREHLSDKEIASSQSEISTEWLPVVEKRIGTSRSVNSGVKGAKILIVEDNKEVREFVAELLSDQFNIETAVDGIEGFEKVIDLKPDVVISDVMMPRMDGFELCHKIKSNDIVGHIPVLLLTAKSTSNDQLIGTRKGADAYLTKPFDPELLLEKVKLLVANRKLLYSKYSKKVTLEPKDAEISTVEAKFLNKVMDVIEKNLTNRDFDADILAEKVASSPSTLYRKLKKSTQQTPGEFIKSIRLKRAAQFLAESDLSVSEIVEKVGYLDIQNFRRSFKNIFGCVPMEYRKQMQKK